MFFFNFIVNLTIDSFPHSLSTLEEKDSPSNICSENKREEQGPTPLRLVYVRTLKCVITAGPSSLGPSCPGCWTREEGHKFISLEKRWGWHYFLCLWEAAIKPNKETLERQRGRQEGETEESPCLASRLNSLPPAALTDFSDPSVLLVLCHRQPVFL